VPLELLGTLPKSERVQSQSSRPLRLAPLEPAQALVAPAQKPTLEQARVLLPHSP
jgi:hypothetical protein